MNICVISTSYPNEDGVGNTFVEQLVNSFVKKGHDCVVISPMIVRPNNSTFLHYKRKEIKRVDDEKTVRVFRPRYYLNRLKFRGVHIGRYLAQRCIEHVIKREKLQIDCLYCHFFAAALTAWDYAHKNNIPLFVATGESKIQFPMSLPNFSFTWETFVKDTTGVICVSTKNLMESTNLGIADIDKCRVFPNGVNLNMFKLLDKQSCRKKLGLNENDFIIITVGEISDRKGQCRVIEAFDLLDINNKKYIVIGQGETLPTKDYIITPGRIAHQDLNIYLNAADIFVLPTLREGCSNAIIEAMASGLPIVSSKLPFNDDILSDKNAILVNPLDVKEIADAILLLYKDINLRKDKSKGALERASLLSIDARADNILNFMNERISCRDCE